MMVVFLRIQPGKVPEEPQPEGLDPFRDWQAGGKLGDKFLTYLLQLYLGFLELLQLGRILRPLHFQRVKFLLEVFDLGPQSVHLLL